MNVVRSVSNRPTHTLTAREYAFWLWGIFACGVLVGFGLAWLVL